MIRVFHGQYEAAAPLIFWAIVLDLLDGRIARMTGTTSEFGGELDSLADAISFGVAPALLAYAWGFGAVPRVGWLAAFLFVVCGALRLARFNVQRQATDGRFFVGLPIPAAAAMVAALVNFRPEPIADRSLAFACVSLMVILAFLMVSTFRYWSFKNVDLRSRRSYVMIVGIAVSLILVALHTEWVLLLLATAFWLSGPLAFLAGAARRRPAGAPAVAQGESP
jgi:CDP-diacylglycerol--serine O-phosphatidyltransferase